MADVSLMYMLPSGCLFVVGKLATAVGVAIITSSANLDNRYEVS